MDAAALARLEHENLIEALVAVASLAPGAHVERAHGVAIASNGLPFVLFNQVIVDDDPEPAAIARGVAVMRERGARFVVNLRNGKDNAFVPLMAELGLVPISERPWMPGMAVHPLPQTPSSVVQGHEIRQVTDRGGVRDHVTTAATGFEMPLEWVEILVTDKLLEQAEARLYVGYVDGKPATTGLGFQTGRTIGVYNISTIESERRRGYGAAITMRIVEDGAAAGCDVAILQASEMGYSIYERLGFRTVVEYCGYVEPATLPRR